MLGLLFSTILGSLGISIFLVGLGLGFVVFVDGFLLFGLCIAIELCLWLLGLCLARGRWRFCFSLLGFLFRSLCLVLDRVI